MVSVETLIVAAPLTKMTCGMFGWLLGAPSKLMVMVWPGASGTPKDEVGAVPSKLTFTVPVEADGLVMKITLVFGSNRVNTGAAVPDTVTCLFVAKAETPERRAITAMRKDRIFMAWAEE